MYRVGISLSVIALLTMKSVQADEDEHRRYPRHHNHDDDYDDHDDDDDECNHQCAAYCAANGEDDDCFEECGCDEEDGYEDLDRVLRTYNNYRQAHTRDQTASRMQTLSAAGPQARQYSAAYVQAHEQYGQAQAQYQHAFQHAGLNQACDMNCVYDCSAANIGHAQQCYARCGCIQQVAGKALFSVPGVGGNYGAYASQYMGSVGSAQPATTTSTSASSGMNFGDYSQYTNQFLGSQASVGQASTPATGSATGIADYSNYASQFMSGYGAGAQANAATVHTTTNSKIAQQFIGSNSMLGGLTGASAQSQIPQASADYLANYQALLAFNHHQSATPTYTSTTTTAQQSGSDQDLMARWHKATSNNHWSTKQNAQATTQVHQQYTSPSSSHHHTATQSTPQTTSHSWSSQTYTQPTTQQTTTFKPAAYPSQTTTFQPAAYPSQTTTFQPAAFPSTTTTAAYDQAAKTSQWGTWADKWYNYQSPYGQLPSTIPQAAPSTASITPAISILSEAEAGEAGEAGELAEAEEVVPAEEAAPAEPAAAAEATVVSAAPAEAAAVTTEKAKAAMTVVEYVTYVEEQRNQDRISAAAIYNYVMEDELVNKVYGEVTKGELNILGEYLTQSATNVKVELSQIGEKIIQTLQQQRQAIDVNRVGVCLPSQTQSTTQSSVGISTPSLGQLVAGATGTSTGVAGAVDALAGTQSGSVQIGGTTTTSTSTTTTTTKGCIPPSAIIKTTPAGQIASDKIYERILDAKTLNSLTSASINVTYLPEFENAQKVAFTYGGVNHNNYVLIRNTATLKEVIVLELETYLVKSVYAATLIKNITSPTGFSISLAKGTITPETTAYIQTFINSQTAFIVSSMKNVAVSKAGCFYLHTNLSYAAAASWEIITDSVTTLSTKMLVRALDATKTAIQYYLVDVSPYENMIGAYQLTITLQDKTVHKLIVLLQSTAQVQTLSFDTVIISNNLVVDKQVITLVYSNGGYTTTTKALTTPDGQLNLLISQFLALKETIIISEESSAAVQALMKWVFNANVKDITIRKISDSMRGSRLQIVYLTHTYTVDVIQITFEGYDSMYRIFFKEPTGATAVYNIIVHSKGNQVYEASILIGTTLVSTYQLTLIPVAGQRNAYTSTSIIEVLESKEMTTIVTTYKNYIVNQGVATTTTTKVVDQTQTNKTTGIQIPISTGVVVTNTTTVTIDPSLPNIKISEVTVNSTTQTTTPGIGITIPGAVAGIISTTKTVVSNVTDISTSGSSTSTISTQTIGGGSTSGSSSTSTLVISGGGSSTTTSTTTGGQTGGQTGGSVAIRNETTSTTTTTTTTPVTTGGSSSSSSTTTTKTGGLNLVSEGVKTITTSNIIDSTITTQTGGSTIVTKNVTELINTGAQTGVSTTISNTTFTNTTAIITKVPDYNIVRNPVNNEAYYVYLNGSVYNAQGFILTTGGVTELTRIISSTVTTTQSADGSYGIATHNGITYYIYTNGTVTTDKGVYVCSNGIDGLTLYISTLGSSSSSTTTTTTGGSTGGSSSSSSTTTTTTTSTTTGGSTSGVVSGGSSSTSTTTTTTSGAEGISIHQNGPGLVSGSITASVSVASGSAPSYQLITLSDGSVYRFYADGTISSMSGQIVSTTGLAGFTTYLSSSTIVRTIISTAAPDYQIIVGNGVEYFLYSNQTVTTSTGEFITASGIEGLRAYLTTQRTITTTVASDFQIVNANGVEYRLYNNGSVYDITGSLITTEGVTGLRTYLTTYKSTTTTIAADFQTVTANGIDYRLYTNGSIYDAAGVYVTNGGIEGLKAYLTTYQTTTTTIPSDFQIVNANGIEYRLYTNGSVYDNMGVFVTAGGVEGLKVYLTTYTSTTTTTVPDYQVVTANGVDHWVYTNGSVYGANGGAFITNGGIEGLKAHLVTHQTVTTTVPSDYQVVTANGQDYRLYTNGSAYNAAGALISTEGLVGLRTFLTTSTTTTQTIVPDFQTVTANGIDYKMYNNGSVYDAAGVWVTEGGVAGITQFLTSGMRTGTNPNIGATTALFLNNYNEQTKHQMTGFETLIVLIIIGFVAIGSMKIYFSIKNQRENMKSSSPVRRSNERHLQSHVGYSALKDKAY